VRAGVRLAVDWGQARIGVAACDPGGVLAYPVRTIAAGPGAMDELRALVAEYEPIEVVLGLPRTLRGTDEIAARNVREVAGAVRSATGLPVRLVDERLTTASASKLLHAAGRTTRRQRGVIDQAAAVALLEVALEYERTTGRPAGEGVPERPEKGPEWRAGSHVT